MTDIKDEIIEAQLSPAETWIKQFDFPLEGSHNLETMWKMYLNWCDRNAIPREDSGRMLGFAKKISKYCYVEKVGRTRQYSSLDGRIGMTTSPAEAKAFTELRKKQKEVAADLKRRLE
jgi:hypothetical protein